MALLGLFLALLGIYGVVAQMVVHRTSEIGVRMALGADIGQIFRMVLGAGVRLALAGTALGVIGAWMVVRLAVTLLPEVPAMSPWLAALIAALLVGAALVASWLPARRVVRIDPVIALRGD